MNKKLRLADIEEPVRTFLDEALTGGGIVIEDETGRARGGVVPYFEASEEEKRQAWDSLKSVQEKVGQAMQEQGVTEEDVDRLLQEDD